MIDNYKKGNLSDADFSMYLDRALAKESNPNAKAEILQHAVDQINCYLVPNHDVESLVILYSDQLAALSARSDVVANALVEYAVANERKAEGTNGDKKNAHLLSSLRAWIALSKILSESLTQTVKVSSPGVGGFLYMGDPGAPQLKAIQAKHEAEQKAHDLAEQQNRMVDLIMPAKDGMKRVKDELKMDDEAFSRIWMDVKTRKFNEGAK